MIGLDTNVLVRYFVRDDSAQAHRALSTIQSGLTAERPGFISLITMAELVWVLDRSYKLTTAEVAEIVFTLLSTNVFRVQNPSQVYEAYQALLNGFDFGDALIGALSRLHHCEKVLTFDRKASRLPGFELI